MKVNVREEQGVSVIATSGELDAASSPDVEQALDRLMNEARRRFVIDLSATSFIDSSGLALLVRAFKRVRGGGGKLFVAGLQPAVRKVFELTRLDKAFDLSPSAEEAVRRAAG